MTTNREIYLSVLAIVERANGCDRSLEEYLRALVAIVCPYKDLEYLSPDEFLNVLSESLMADPLPMEPLWVDTYEVERALVNDFRCWEATVWQQVVDLREM